MRKEAKLTSTLGKWCKANLSTLYPHQSIAIEVKQCKTSCPFNALQEHQELALYNAKHNHLYWKIPDCGFQNPFDVMYLSHTLSFVVVYYEALKSFVFIDIDTWQTEKATSSRKSLSHERAIEIATQTVRLKEMNLLQRHRHR